MASLRVENITKTFGAVTALSHVNLSIEQGEFCVLLGPSGCGKSTLLNIVAGLIPQDEGRVFLDDRLVDGLTPRERDVAVVFQSYALYPHMTVSQNLGFGLRMRGASKKTIHSRVQEAARLLGIEDLLHRKPRELSGGQRQRVAMGRALVRRPRIFLLDEPLSNLDARLRAVVRLELKRLHRKISGTMLYVTHDQVEAMTLGDKVVVMREGEVRQIGAPTDIYARPSDTFVARFIGTPEINLYSGTLIWKNDIASFQGRGFSVELDMPKGAPAGGQIEIGIRPEDIQVLDRNRETPLQAEIEMISDIGSEKFIHARTGEEDITVRISKETGFRVGGKVSLAFAPRSIHVFAEGLNITNSEEDRLESQKPF